MDELLEHPSPLALLDRVETWRLEQLLNAGYPLALAEQLATRPPSEVDLHQAVELVASRGCLPELAARILL
jgi:hypothetical protein